MKHTLVFIFLLATASLPLHSTVGQSAKVQEAGWILSIQTYTFNRYNFTEAVEKAAELGLKHIEIYFGQTLGGDMEGRMRFDMDDDTKTKIKALLDKHGLEIVCAGVVSPKTEDDWRKLFAFAKDMGIGTINSEPDPSLMDLLDKLTAEHGINLAIHNHPEPSRYWNPDTVLETIKGRNPRIGACADVGHWLRSGLDPIECIKKLEGKILSLHFKDLNEKDNKKAHDVPWGTGVGNIKGVLEELKRQGFKGNFSIEYEHNWTSSMPEIAESIAYFNKVTEEIF